MKDSPTRQGIGVLVLVLIVLGTAIAIAGCGDETTAGAGPYTLTKADNGKAITIKFGESFDIVLEGNPTTGYTWTPALTDQDAAVVEQQGEPTYIQASTDKTLVGGGGTFTFTFKGIAKGQATVKLDYARPFEKDVAPIETFSVSVTVQ